MVKNREKNKKRREQDNKYYHNNCYADNTLCSSNHYVIWSSFVDKYTILVVYILQTEVHTANSSPSYLA